MPLAIKRHSRVDTVKSSGNEARKSMPQMTIDNMPDLGRTRAAPSHRQPAWLKPLALVLLVALCYAPAISPCHIWDDGDYLLDNRLVQRDSGPGWIWLSPEM